MTRNASSIIDSIFDDTPEPTGDEFYVSATKMDTWLSCGIKSMLQYKLGLRPLMVPTPVAFGGAVHDALEIYNYGLVEDKPDLDKALDKFHTLWAKLADSGTMEETSKKNTIAGLTDVGEGLIRDFARHKSRAQYRPMRDEDGSPMIEYGFYIEILPNVFAHGYIDVIEANKKGDMRITDYKTCGMPFIDPKSYIDPQMMIYSLALEHLLQEGKVKKTGDIRVGLQELDKNKKKVGKAHFRKIWDVPTHICKKMIGSFVHGFKNDLFVPYYNRMICYNCSYKPACLAYMQGKDPMNVRGFTTKKRARIT